MRVYYNEWDKYCAQWLRNLIAAGLIPAGDVDDRDIRLVQPGDLIGYDQCHFFAGIAGWTLALDLAGWGTRPAWTASCPCQPFSAAGKRKGTEDERHLWPELLRLVAASKPATLFGEQVASADGRKWLAGVRLGLEALGYRVGAADLCAAGVAAPHIRQRLFWVADANGRDAGAEGLQRSGQYGLGTEDGCAGERMAITEGEQRHGAGLAWPGRRQPSDGVGLGEPASEQMGIPGFAWRQSDTVDCADGKTRRIEPGTFPLAHGIPSRVGKLRAYGNAIVPQTAAQFIGAYMEAA